MSNRFVNVAHRERAYQSLIANMRPNEGLHAREAPDLTQWFDHLETRFFEAPEPKINVCLEPIADLDTSVNELGQVSVRGNYFSRPVLESQVAADELEPASKRWRDLDSSEALFQFIEQRSLKISNLPTFMCDWVSANVPTSRKK